jgi:two-component system cell cycle sensor histidine kinase/response regulator CckA
MEKKQYIESQMEKLIQSWMSISAILGIFLFMSLSLLDYFVTPENFSRFLIYRISISLFLFLLLLLNKLKRKLHYQYVIIVLGIIFSAITLELMILNFGGHKSIYYAGLNLLILCVLGVLPLNLPIALSISALLYCIYLFPILVLDKITNLGLFINNNVFLISTIVVAFAWRILNQTSITKELELQYDLEKDKQQLKIYSTRLEELVAERTKELNKSELMLRSLFENANDGIMIMDKNGIILNVNQKACDLHEFDRDLLIGTNIGLLETEDNKQASRERMERILKGESMTFETQHYRRDGSRISLEISSKAIEVEGNLLIQSFHRDITEKKRLQGQLFQSQKMESIGVLAGGIAHDFNNILSAILGHAELLHEFSNLDSAGKQRVTIIENSARKAGQMISKLLSFARKGSFESIPINLNDVIKDTTELLDRMMTKKKITLQLMMDNSLPPINGDSNQLEQVLMNLVVNAGDVMPNGGFITIATSQITLGDEAVTIHLLLTPGRYVVLKVTDTGAGIPEEIRDRIFDPFFTTKAAGKGTGLGLAMVYGIVKEHKGIINVRSEMGKGTSFEIYFPMSEKAVPQVEKSALYPLEGREKILVVDDEEDILSFIKDVLETQGYRVMVTTNPVYALDIFKEISDTIDLVITDIVLPLVNGRELIKRFKSVKPEVKLIAMSGYEAGVIDRRDKDIDAFIRKPFQGIYLLSMVRKVLDTAGFSSYTSRNMSP